MLDALVMRQREKDKGRKEKTYWGVGSVFAKYQSTSFFVEYNPPLSSVLWDVLLCSQTDVD
jgi:hypothetical protein